MAYTLCHTLAIRKPQPYLFDSGFIDRCFSLLQSWQGPGVHRTVLAKKKRKQGNSDRLVSYGVDSIIANFAFHLVHLSYSPSVLLVPRHRASVAPSQLHVCRENAERLRIQQQPRALHASMLYMLVGAACESQDGPYFAGNSGTPKCIPAMRFAAESLLSALAVHPGRSSTTARWTSWGCMSLERRAT